MKQKTKFSNSQLRQMIRPMFSSTISFGYATPEQVENTLDEMFGEDSRKITAKMEKRKKHTRAVEIVREAQIIFDTIAELMEKNEHTC
jgi:hypothetical protein